DVYKRQAVSCEKPEATGEPCNNCSACNEINEGRAIDIIEIDAASTGGVDSIRELNEGVKFAPSRLKYKVFIIDESHQISREGANALLKTLEEPPSHAIFILATTEAHKMIPTIVSRTQRFDFRKLTVPEIVGRLEGIAKKEKVVIEKEALELIAVNVGGALRDAESLLDKVLTFGQKNGKTAKITVDAVKDLLGIVDIEVISEFVDKLSEKKAGEAIEFLNLKIEEGMDPQEFAKNLVRYLRQTLLLKINPSLKDMLSAGFSKEQLEKMEKQGEKVKEEELTQILDRFSAAENRMKYASIVQLPLELATIDSCGIV
ncbi:MAG TPA: DNA polymerase III subunit gamma/tau, partial [candidate division CPR3 bacterium]|nr:DNA polymerase III subunit gamma/tau [candidate division CPR3 bacterium]